MSDMYRAAYEDEFGGDCFNITEKKVAWEAWRAACEFMVGKIGEAWDNGSNSQLPLIGMLEGRIEELEARLEVNELHPHYDGIACRDVTIREMEREIGCLKDNK